MAVPYAVQKATAPRERVESQKLSDGVWFVAGGSHNSLVIFFFYYSGDHQDLHGDEHSFPTRRSSDLPAFAWQASECNWKLPPAECSLRVLLPPPADRKSTRLNSSHSSPSRMPSSA